MQNLTWHVMPEDANADISITIEYAIDVEDVYGLYQRVSDTADGSCQVFRYPVTHGEFVPAAGVIPEFDDNAGVMIEDRPKWCSML